MKYLFHIVSLLIAFDSSAQNFWTQKSDFGGGFRSLAFAFSVASKGYIGAGRDDLGNSKNDFWEYDPVSDTWTQKADFSGTPREWSFAFSIGQKGYAGAGEDDVDFRRDFWEYDPASNSWTQKADFGGTARVNAISFSAGNKGYAGLGYDTTFNRVRDIWEYDPAADLWIQKSDFGGTARTGAFSFSIGTMGYVGAGVDSVDPYPNSDFWSYDSASDTWTQKADVGQSSVASTGFSIGGKGYTHSGRQFNLDCVTGFWEYDPSINTWTEKSYASGLNRFNAVSFSIGSKGYVGPGFGDFGVVSDFWEYTPDTISTIFPEQLCLNLDIYPTVVTKSFEIRNAERFLGGLLFIYDTKGKIHYSETLKNVQITISTESIPKGVYFIRLIIEGKKAMQRFIKL